MDADQTLEIALPRNVMDVYHERARVRQCSVRNEVESTLRREARASRAAGVEGAKPTIEWPTATEWIVRDADGREIKRGTDTQVHTAYVKPRETWVHVKEALTDPDCTHIQARDIVTVAEWEVDSTLTRCPHCTPRAPSPTERRIEALEAEVRVLRRWVAAKVDHDRFGGVIDSEALRARIRNVLEYTTVDHLVTNQDVDELTDDLIAGITKEN